MALIIKTNTLYQILLALCLAVPYGGSYELTFLIWSFTVFVTLQKKYSFPFVKYLLCFVLILILAFFSTKFDKNNLFFIIRDSTYLLKPIIGLLVGYQICKYNFNNLFGKILNIGLLISIIHLSFILYALIFHQAFTINELRYYGGYFSDFEIYALILVLFHNKFQIQLTRNKCYLIALTIGLSSFLYLSRGNIIQFVVLFLALKGYFKLTKRAIITIFSVIGLVLVSYSIIYHLNPRRNGQGLEALLYKIKIAPIEPFKSRINTADYIDFNDNYRSVETINTIKQMNNNGTNAIIFGSGLGSTVDLKRDVYLGDMKMRFISVLHNGFMTTYLKSGILGVILLLYSIYLVYNQPKSSITINQNVNNLLIGTAVFLVISNGVLMGYYFTEDSKSILVGLLFAYKEINAKKENKKLLV
jgi:hypothetical protein